MHFKRFIQDKLPTVGLLLCGIGTIEILLLAYPVGAFMKVYIPLVIAVLYGIGVGIEYFTKKKFYQNLEDTLARLDDKYLISEIIKTPSFTEGEILKTVLDITNKSMLEKVNAYKHMQEDYKEYIELWIHEIKIPIATSKLIVENNKNPTTKSIDEELDKVENYIEQALYYARSHTVEKDYYIKKVPLRDIVGDSIKKHKNTLVHEKVSVHVHDLEPEVHTDSKWIVFILGQLLQNSCKYQKPDGNLEIEIYAKPGKENVVLYVRDTGIGIPEGELARVFDKGFTGTNGRIIGKKSTGIGLYLCKNLCCKLGIAIELRSVEGEGTEIRLIFPKGSYIDMP